MLDALREDRAQLSKRVGMPAWLAPTIGFLTAAWVASPALGDQTATFAYPISLGGIVLAIYLAAHTAGVRHGRLRGRAYWIVGAAIVIGLALYSTSLGLVSFDLRWWVILPVLATAGVGCAATRLVERESLARSPVAADRSPATDRDELAFDEIIHAPMRLRICGLLRPVDALSFVVLRDTLDLTPAALSKHLKVLTDSGYVTMDKTASRDRVDLRRVAWVQLTPLGRNSFDGHIAALQAIIRPHD